MIRLSQSSYQMYLKCPKAWDYAYNKRLEKRIFNINFFVGNLIHEGLHMIYKKDEDIFSIMIKKVDEAVEQEREKHLFSPEEEKKLEEWKVIILGMLYAYSIKNGKFIDDHEHLHNELTHNIDLGDDVFFQIKIDNVLRNKEKQFIHEIKTTRELNENYVAAIKTSVQIACYYHFGKMVEGFNPEGVIYDVLQKPSIRVKKDEAYEDYLARLQDYYEKEPDKHLWTEIVDEPAISREDLIASIKDVAERIKEGRFKPSFQTCGLCDYNKLCYNNDAPEFMMGYQKKEDNTSGTIAN